MTLTVTRNQFSQPQWSHRKLTRQLRLETLEHRFVLAALSFTSIGTFPAGPSPWDVTSSDLNGDGVEDLAVANFASGGSPVGDVSVLMGIGDGTFEDEVRYQAGDKPCGIRSADLNGDGHIDLTVANVNSFNVSILLNSGDGTFGDATHYRTARFPCSLVIADLNGDQLPDLAVSNQRAPSVSILLGQGDGTFEKKADVSAGSNPTDLVAGDLDSDGDVDLAVGDGDGGRLSVLLNQGDASFPELNRITVNRNERTVSVAAGDLDGDGDLDFAVARNQKGGSEVGGGVDVFMGIGDGTFALAAGYDAGNQPADLVLEDFNGDGKLDLVATNRFDSTFSILAGNGDGTFGQRETFDSMAFPSALAAADFNGDSVLDLAVDTQATSVGIAIALNESIPPLLRAIAGDANMDGVFDQLDIVQVLQTNKYLTGEPATFSEGDFNGDNLFDQLDIVTALAEGKYLQGTAAWIPKAVDSGLKHPPPKAVAFGEP